MYTTQASHALLPDVAACFPIFAHALMHLFMYPDCDTVAPVSYILIQQRARYPVFQDGDYVNTDDFDIMWIIILCRCKLGWVIVCCLDSSSTKVFCTSILIVRCLYICSFLRGQHQNNYLFLCHLVTLKYKLIWPAQLHKRFHLTVFFGGARGYIK